MMENEFAQFMTVDRQTHLYGNESQLQKHYMNTIVRFENVQLYVIRKL